MLKNKSSAPLINDRREKMLVISSTLTGGSWGCIADLIKKSSAKFRTHVIGYSSNLSQVEGIPATFLRLPFLSFEKWGYIIARTKILPLLYTFPLIFITYLSAFTFRPKIILGNGLFVTIPCVPIAKLLKSHLIIAYHTRIQNYIGQFESRLVRFFCRHVDLVIVNSIGSFNDASLVVDSQNIVTVEHWADDFFFRDQNRSLIRQKYDFGNRFVILYVGRLDKDKCFEILLNTAKIMKDQEDVLFFIVGEGEFSADLKKLATVQSNIKYSGFIKDREKLCELFSAADLVWSYADETYLAKPAVEALACGTPILVPNVAADGISKIDPNLVPKEIGWLLHPADVNEASQLIFGILLENRPTNEMRKRCREYAKLRYSSGNLDSAIKATLALINRN